MIAKNDRPYRISASGIWTLPLRREGSVDRWFSTDTLVRDAGLQLPSSRVQLPLQFSGIRGDGQWALDNPFPVAELVQIQLRAEVYNTFNPGLLTRRVSRRPIATRQAGRLAR